MLKREIILLRKTWGEVDDSTAGTVAMLLCDLAFRFSFISKFLTLLSFFPSLCKMFTSTPMATESSLNNPSGMHMCHLETEPIVLGTCLLCLWKDKHHWGRRPRLSKLQRGTPRSYQRKKCREGAYHGPPKA